MPIIKHTITINRNVMDVFRAATDFDNIHTWQAGTSSVNVVSGDPIRSGTMVSIQRGGLFVNADVLDFQRNKLVTIKGVWGRFRFTRTQEFQSGNRETTVKDTLNIQTGWLYFWYAPFLNMLVSGQLRADWNRLKQQLENTPSFSS